MQSTLEIVKDKRKSQIVRTNIPQQSLSGFRKWNNGTKRYSIITRINDSIHPIAINEVEVDWKYHGVYVWHNVYSKEYLELLWNIVVNNFNTKPIKLTTDLEPWIFVKWIYSSIEQYLKIDLSNNSSLYIDTDNREGKCLVNIIDDDLECSIEPDYAFYSFLPRMRKRSPKAFWLMIDMLNLMNTRLGIDLWWEGYQDYLEEIHEEELENWVENNIGDDPTDEDIKELKKRKRDFAIENNKYNVNGIAYRYKRLIKFRDTDFTKFKRDVKAYKPKKAHYRIFKQLLELTIELLSTNENIDDHIYCTDNDSEVVYPSEVLSFQWERGGYMTQLIDDDMEMKANCSFMLKPFQTFDTYYEDGKYTSNRESEFPYLLKRWWDKQIELRLFIKVFYNE